MTNLKKHLLLFIPILLAAAVASGAGEPLFPFVLPWDDASPSVTNLSGLLGAPAGGRGFVAARDGHLFEGEKRLRIFGVNTAFGADFPTHGDAEKVAARMAKFGINCVRFHHMDTQSTPTGIWSADGRTLDPAQLDKLDYFIAQLKKNGIYADLNLHVGRFYPGMPKWEHMPGYFKGVDHFYPPMIAMQREYARQLLTHINPYTKTAYTDEPAVAIVEINNEDGLISEWWNGALDAMNDVYGAELEARWNRWLQKKYPAPDAIAQAWNASQQPLGEEMLKEPAFENGLGAAWYLEQNEGAKASAARDTEGLRLSVTQPAAEGWYVQLSQNKIALSGSARYTVTFRARADAPRQLRVVAAQAHAPWSALWSAPAQLTTEWKEFHFAFQPSAAEENARLVFSNLGTVKGDTWLADVSLRTGGVFGLKKDERPGAIPIFKKSEFATRTAEAQRDWMSFLNDTESDYWTGMSQFLKRDLKARSLIVGTATDFSPPTIQAKLDVVDVHAYWQHPHFPRKPWDPADWTINNISMAGDPAGGTLPRLADRRVAGKPYICTEYNEPFPNTHSSEAFLLLNAYAALQDWDGVFAFDYSSRLNDWNSQRISSFFDIDQNPAKLVTLPAAVSIFLRADVSKAQKAITIPVSPAAAVDASVLYGPWGMESFGLNRMAPFQSLVQLDLSGKTPPAAPITAKADKESPNKVTISDTGELTWDASKSLVTINTPRNKAFIGKITGEPITLGDLIIQPRPNPQNWAAITFTNTNSPDEILITATGYSENTGMRWNAKKTSVGRDWGKSPSLVEGISAKLTLPPRFYDAEAWALDGQGHRKFRVKLTHDSGATILDLAPQYQTLWYEVNIPVP